MIKKNMQMGYLCGNAIPFEVFHSCNIKLTKVTGDGVVSSSSKCQFPAYMCSYAMNCLDIIVKDHKYDGFVFENKCHAMTTLYEYLREYMPQKKLFMFNTAKTNSLHTIENYHKERLRLIKFLKTEFNVSIPDETLQTNIISLRNMMDQRRKIIDNIAENSISLSFTDIRILEKQLGERSEENDIEVKGLEKKILQNPISKIETAILLCGIHITPLDIIDVVNEYGGKVILYDNLEMNQLDNVSLFFSSDKINVKKTDQEEEICNWNPGWLQLFEKKLDHYNIRAIIISTIKFCPIQSYRIILLAELAKRRSIPFLVLNDSFSRNCSAQVHTRIQAFLECV